VAGTCGYGKGLAGSINAGNFLTSSKVYWLASQEGLCSMESWSAPAELYCYNSFSWQRRIPFFLTIFSFSITAHVVFVSEVIT